LVKRVSEWLVALTDSVIVLSSEMVFDFGTAEELDDFDILKIG